MIFNPDASSQEQQIVFCQKESAINHGTIYFNNNNVLVIRENIPKHLGLFPDSKLNFFDHINEKMKKVTKGGQCYKKNELVVITFFCADNM